MDIRGGSLERRRRTIVSSAVANVEATEAAASVEI